LPRPALEANASAADCMLVELREVVAALAVVLADSMTPVCSAAMYASRTARCRESVRCTSVRSRPIRESAVIIWGYKAP
jgi:hypothetical protein